MATNRFAHWNSFPFMTAPRTKYYSGQMQSPLFRLSREIRDIIYAYYLLGRDNEGYHYDYDTGKMLERTPRLEPKRVVRLGLIITCRIAAEELQDYALRKVHFNTHRSLDDGQLFLGLCSRAGRFDCMLGYVDSQKRRMLIRVSELLEPEDFSDLYACFPSVKRWFKQCLMASVETQSDQFFWTDSGGYGRNPYSLEFSDALQHILILAKNRNPPKFAELACTVFGLGRCSLDGGIATSYRNNYFVEGALCHIFSWHPKPWSLPSDDELTRLEAFICTPRDTDTRLFITDDGVFYFTDVSDHVQASRRRWYFSAASVAIDFLQKLPPKQMHNLQTLILNENWRSVSRPEQHARGFIPFCIKNPKLRIERRIQLSANLFLTRTSHYFCGTEGCFRVTMRWVKAALELVTLGMRAGSFTLAIDGTTTGMTDVWTVFKYVAALQEANREYYRLKGYPIPAQPVEPQYKHTWDFPDDFFKIIRDITEGTSVVRFDGDAGDTWDPNKVLGKRINWTRDEWKWDWTNNVFSYDVAEKIFGVSRF